MKTFTLKKSEFILPDDLYLRIGASNGSSAYYKHVYCSKKTYNKIESRLEKHVQKNIKDKAKAKREFLKLLLERSPKICDGIKCGILLVDTKAISADIRDEEMVNDLAESSRNLALLNPHTRSSFE